MHEGAITGDGVDSLQALIGQNIRALYAPFVEVHFFGDGQNDFDGPQANAWQLTFRCGPKDSFFVNLSTNWVQIPCGNYHEFLIERGDTPQSIPFEPPKKKNQSGTVGPSSTIEVRAGVLEKIEIMEAIERIDWKGKDGDSGTEIVRYDQILNFFGEDGEFSLTSKFETIMGDIEIRPTVITPMKNKEKELRVRAELT